MARQKLLAMVSLTDGQGCSQEVYLSSVLSEWTGNLCNLSLSHTILHLRSGTWQARGSWQ